MHHDGQDEDQALSLEPLDQLAAAGEPSFRSVPVVLPRVREQPPTARPRPGRLPRPA